LNEEYVIGYKFAVFIEA